MARLTKPNLTREVMYDVIQAGVQAVIDGTVEVDLNGIEIESLLGKNKDGLILQIIEDGESKHITIKPTVKKAMIDEADIEARSPYLEQLEEYEEEKGSTATTNTTAKDKSPQTQDFAKLLDQQDLDKMKDAKAEEPEATNNVEDLAKQLGLS